jgi:heat shock protein HslJ
MKALTCMLLLPAALLVGCAGTGKEDVPTPITSENAVKLHNRQWDLKSISVDANQVILDLDANMTLVFGADGKVTGYGSINRFNGAYSFGQDGRLSWPGPGFITTRKAGPPELMEKERMYLEALRETNRAILKGKTLQLQNEGGSTALLFTETGTR